MRSFSASLERWRAHLALALVVLATLAGGLGALSVYRSDRSLSVGTIRLSTDLGHRGSLDIYVPLVDWGVRFPVVRFPARLTTSVRTLDRKRVAEIANGRRPSVEDVRAEARDEIASYVRRLILVVLVASLASGALVSLALRGGSAPRLRVMLIAGGGTGVVLSLALAILLPPRGHLDAPEYYANGSDVPVALRLVQNATRSSAAISEELNEQLRGLAQLVSRLGQRPRLSPLPRLTLASDLHNNVLALPALERAAGGRPLFFAGDLTANGSPFELRLTRRVASAAEPFVFVSGNHDSREVERGLARAGAIVLTERGRLLANGRHGRTVVVRVAGLRVAGYGDPFERRRSSGYRAEGEPEPSARQQHAFWIWLRGLIGKADIVMVHSPTLAEQAIRELRAHSPPEPMALLVGHTHEQELRTSENLVLLNGGTIGGGGAGNFQEEQPFGLAVMTYRLNGHFRPVAADLVEINHQNGSTRAERHLLRLGEGKQAQDASR
jgi:predicted phosphodiesterase